MQELKFIQRMDLLLEYYTTNDISNVISSITPFNKKEIKRNDILDYLKHINNIIEDTYAENLEKYILTASAIYIFADPLLNIIKDSNDEKIKKTYISCLNETPYNIDFPLNPYFLRSNQDSFNNPKQSSLIEITDTIINDTIKFSRSQNFSQQIIQELSNITKLLSPSIKKRTYSRAKHFTFVGYYDICRPLFNIQVNKEYYKKMNNYLKENFGTWLIQAPEKFN
jgi:hypothetical protein